MAKNIELVRQEVAAMRNEVEDFANSAERVGGVVSDVLEYGHEQLTDGKNKHEALAERVTVAEGNISAEVARAQAAEELISQQAEQNFKNFSDLGVEESAKMDGYEIALTKKTNTAEKTKVKVPVYDMQNPSFTPVGLVDELFVEDVRAAISKEVTAEKERAKAAEGEIRGSVESLSEDLNAVSEDIGKLEVALEAEKSRAKGAEQDLSMEITEAENRVDEQVTEVRDNLEAEVQARSEAVADLQANTGISEYPAFDAAVDYAVGDVVKYEGRLYRFTAEHAAGEWIGTDAENFSFEGRYKSENIRIIADKSSVKGIADKYNRSILELYIYDQYLDANSNTEKAIILNNQNNSLCRIFIYSDYQNLTLKYRSADVNPVNNEVVPIDTLEGVRLGYIIFRDAELFLSISYASIGNIINPITALSISKNPKILEYLVSKNKTDIITETQRAKQAENILQEGVNEVGMAISNQTNTLQNEIIHIKDIQDKVVNVDISDNSEVALTYHSGSPKLTKAYTNSTFSGYGQYIGIIPTSFRYLATKVFCSDWVDNPAPITQILVQFRANKQDGELLKEKLFYVMVEVGEEKDIVLDFKEDISFATDVFMNIRLNSYGVLYRNQGTVTYPSEYTQLGVYWTNGNIKSSSLGTEVSGSEGSSAIGTYKQLYWVLYKTLDYNVKLTDEQIEDINNRLPVKPVIEKTVGISLPNKIYAVVGDTLQLFYRGIVQAVNPYNYNIRVACSKGKQYPRYFEYTPTTSDIGTVEFKIDILDDNRELISSKTCSLITVAAAQNPVTEKKILCFGDSLTTGGVWCAESYRRLTANGGTPVGLGFTNIKFCGAKNYNGAGYFGIGGWSWTSYTRKGSLGYRFYVTGVNGLSLDSKYSHNGNTFKILEINVTEGIGNILCYVDSLSPAPLSSGTLIKTSGTGDDEITFTSVVQDSSNPLWDSDANKMTFIPYADKYSDGSIDVVYTLLSWNGLIAGKTDFSDIIAEVKIFADTLHAEFPNAKLKIMGVQIPSVTGGMGANYGATGKSYADGYGMVVTAFNMNKAYQDFANSEGYSDFVEFVNVSSQFDTEYNMPYSEVAVNSRNSTKKEIRGTNGVHPDISGYYQIADAVFRNIVANYCQ